MKIPMKHKKHRPNEKYLLTDRYKSCKSKKRYRTEGEALHTASHCMRARGDKLVPYFCQVCNGYHLTKNVEYYDYYFNGKEKTYHDHKRVKSCNQTRDDGYQS